jgi:aminoglycoside phosphotransferase (APT) family kinase protein
VIPAKTPLELAALATVAVPGLRVAGLRPPQFTDELTSVTGIIDVQGNRYLVVCPHDTTGGLNLEAQTAVLARLARARDADQIPFDVPRPSGIAHIAGGGRVMVHPDLGGRFMAEEDFEDSLVLPASLARALASLHNLAPGVYTGVDTPAYTAAECRDRNLALLDEAASAAVIPANLWNRWSAALEDVALWRFQTAPIHGDLQTTSVVVDNGAVLGLTGFSSARVGDPAVDVAWVLAQASDAFLDRFREAYSLARHATDLHLLTRAQLLSELALVRWLVHGVHAEDRSIVEEATRMLSDLADDLGDDPLARPPASLAETPAPASPPSPGAPRGAAPSGEGTGDEGGAASDGADDGDASTGALGDADLPTERLDLDGPRPDHPHPGEPSAPAL